MFALAASQHMRNDPDTGQKVSPLAPAPGTSDDQEADVPVLGGRDCRKLGPSHP